MNLWLLLATASPILWGVTNVLDRSIRKNFVHSDFALTWFMAFWRLPIAIAFFAIGGLPTGNLASILWLIAGGVLWTYPVTFYFKAIEMEDSSIIALFIQLVPVFTLILGTFFLKETLTPHQLIGFILLLTAGFFAAIKKIDQKWHFSKAVLYIALADFLWASSDVIFKKFDPNLANFYQSFGLFLFGAFLISIFTLIIPNKRRNITGHYKNLPKKAWVYLAITTTAGIAGSTSFAFALTLGKVSLTAVLMGIQPLVVLLLGLALKPFCKDIIPEKLTARALALRALSLIFVIVGLVFVQ